MFGWLWLTREEGLWIVPGFVFLTAAATTRAWQQNRLAELLRLPSCFAVTVRLVQLGFFVTNWYVYGKFVGVDVKEENFQDALLQGSAECPVGGNKTIRLTDTWGHAGSLFCQPDFQVSGPLLRGARP